jgi:hypothetical protein
MGYSTQGRGKRGCGCDQVIMHIGILILSKTRPAVKAMTEFTPETYWRAREDRWPGSSGQREGRGSSCQHALYCISLYCTALNE